jgi:hypothetical protein
MPRTFLLPFLLCAAAACGGGGEETPPAPAPAADTVASPQDQAVAAARDPRLLLFDVQTALEAARQEGSPYPTTVEFRADDRWQIFRAALDTAFSEWEYTSDGSAYQLTGEAEGRRLAIASP